MGDIFTLSVDKEDGPVVFQFAKTDVLLCEAKH